MLFDIRKKFIYKLLYNWKDSKECRLFIKIKFMINLLKVLVFKDLIFCLLY